MSGRRGGTPSANRYAERLSVYGWFDINRVPSYAAIWSWGWRSVIFQSIYYYLLWLCGQLFTSLELLINILYIQLLSSLNAMAWGPGTIGSCTLHFPFHKMCQVYTCLGGPRHKCKEHTPHTHICRMFPHRMT